MAMMRITVSEMVEVPDDAEILHAPTGVVSGLRLADGRVVKPWLSYEMEEGDDASDLSHDEMLALGIDVGLDIERTIEQTT
jgi:hypothetical protein